MCSGDGMHAVTYELAWRHLHDPTHRASAEVRKQLGHNLKSSIQYTFRLATLDDPFYPTEGYAIRSAQTSPVMCTALQHLCEHGHWIVRSDLIVVSISFTLVQ